MARVVWSPRARDDLEAICLYIARDSARYAGLFVERLLRATARLADFPLLGREVPDLPGKGCREISFKSYRVIYRLVGSDVEIVTLHHGARRLRDLGAVPSPEE